MSRYHTHKTCVVLVLVCVLFWVICNKIWPKMFYISFCLYFVVACALKWHSFEHTCTSLASHKVCLPTNWGTYKGFKTLLQEILTRRSTVLRYYLVHFFLLISFWKIIEQNYNIKDVATTNGHALPRPFQWRSRFCHCSLSLLAYWHLFVLINPSVHFQYIVSTTKIQVTNWILTTYIS